MMGQKYRLLGTDNELETTGEQDGYWLITLRSNTGQEVGVLMAKKDLIDSTNQKFLIKI